MASQRLVLEVNRLIRAVEIDHGFNELGTPARAVLYFIADAEFEKRRLRVSDLCSHSPFGTPPTVFSRLDELEKNGGISYRDDPKDGRVRLIILTPATRRVLARMSKQLHQTLPGVMDSLSDAGTSAEEVRLTSG